MTVELQDAVKLGLLVVAAIVSVLAHRRGGKVDAASAQNVGTAQVIEGLKALLDNVQEDNQAFREGHRADRQELVDIRAELRAFVADCAAVEEERDALRRENVALRLERDDLRRELDLARHPNDPTTPEVPR